MENRTGNSTGVASAGPATSTIKLEIPPGISDEARKVPVQAISEDPGFMRLQAFLTGVREAVRDQPDAVHTFNRALERAARRASKSGHLLTLTIRSTLDARNHEMSYSFELRSE